MYCIAQVIIDKMRYTFLNNVTKILIILRLSVNAAWLMPVRREVVLVTSTIHSTSLFNLIRRSQKVKLSGSLVGVNLRLNASSKANNERDWFTMPNFKCVDSRKRSTLWMVAAMCLHYGGYEFIRNAVVALFTSSSIGFQSPAAYPLANGLISPFSALLLYLYGRQLNLNGPRTALRSTTFWSVVFIIASCTILQLHQTQFISLSKIVIQLLIGITFLFQNSYNYLIATQQWSFINSVLTPDEGSKWFTLITGTSSLFCAITGCTIPFLIPRTGLVGLFALTAMTLFGAMICQDRAFRIAEANGFQPSTTVSSPTTDADSSNEKKENIFKKAFLVFRRVPTLSALFMEVAAFQCLSTLLTVTFVDLMKNRIESDVLRSAYSSKFYSIVNGSSALLQFLVLPIAMKNLEPKIIWRTMPLVPFAICVYQFGKRGEASLALIAFAVYMTKTIDYSLRSIVYNMAYQPLDFDSRYIGKEIIGVFGSRFGKSGISLIISGFAYSGTLRTAVELPFLSVSACSLWLMGTFWLSTLIPSKAEAQRIVEKRIAQKGS